MSWEVVRLGEVVSFLDNLRRPITAKDRVRGDVPYYGANGQQDSVASHIFNEPLVLLAEDGGHFATPSKGVAYRIDGPSWVNNHAHVLRPRASVDIGFLTRVLENYNLVPFISGSTRGKLTKASAARLPIPLPPLPEQRRIASIFDQADALRAKRRDTLAALDGLAESAFAKCFGEVVENDRGWDDSLVLSDVAEVVSGITKGRKVSGQTREVPYLTVANVQDKSLRLHTVKSIDATEMEISRYLLRRDDLLLTEGGDPDKLGRGALWAEEIDEAIHQNHVFRVRLVDPRIDPVYLSWLVASRRGKNYFLGAAKQTTGIASINSTQLRAFPLLCPPVETQHEFRDMLAAVSTSRRQAETHLAKLDELFAALQHRAFQGEL